MTRHSRAGVFTLPIRTLVLTSICGLVGLPLLTGCTENAPASSPSAAASSDPRTLTVQATDAECKLSSASAPSGSLTFTVTNVGSKVTEFYLYGEDGKRVIGEVEDISPGITRELVLDAEPGNYITACKPGMAGDGIRAPFVVSSAG
jgi:iron uptake system component EfeO